MVILRDHELLAFCEIEYSPNLTKFLKKQPDILNIDNVVVNGFYTKDSALKLKLNVKCDLVLMCSITGLGVDAKMDFDFEITFGNSMDDDYPKQAEIDLDEFVFGYICMEKPYEVYHSSVKIEEMG